MSECTLCGLPTGSGPRSASDVEGTFCCRGCLEVARSLDGVDDSDVDDGDGVDDRTPGHTPPESFDGETAFLHVDGMHCSACEAFLEMTAGEQSGVEAAAASYATDTIRVDYDPDAVSAAELPERLSVAGYTASDRADPAAGNDDDVVRFLVGGGFFGMMAMLWYAVFLYPTYFGYDPLVDLGGLDGRYLFAQIWVFASVVLFYTGYPILRGAYVSLRAGRPNMDLLVSLAAASSYAYSTLAMLLGRTDLYFDVTIAVILVVTAGTQYEARIKERATGMLTDLTTATETAVRRESGESAPRTAVEPGDRLLVRPGERVPFDATVVEGRAAIDEALVTGESLPVTKRPGDEVLGGTIVADAPLVVEVGDDVESTLDVLVRLLWDIQSSRSGVQRLVDRLATVFVPLVIVVALAVGGGLLAMGTPPTAAALVALTVLIVSCPCALGLATPLAVAAGVRDAAERGIIIVSDAVFGEARGVETVVFDKTGTLTDGEMSVLDVTSEGIPEQEVIHRAAVLERASIHPVAEAIVQAARDRDGAARDRDGAAPSGSSANDRGTDSLPDGGTETGAAIDRSDPAPTGTGAAENPGGSDATVNAMILDKGVRGRLGGADTLVGHPSLFDGPEWTVPTRLGDVADQAERDGHIPVFVGSDGIVEGVIAVGDELREDWEASVTELADRGKHIVVLTGDSAGAAGRFEDHPAVDEVFAEVPPEAKAETVRRLAATERVAMVGDGSNDAPALAAADLGIAVAGGTDLAIDAADAVLLNERLAAVPELLSIGRGTDRRIKRNLAWAFAYNVIAIPLAVTGVLNPLLAALAMASSSLLVVANSARAVVDT